MLQPNKDTSSSRNEKLAMNCGLENETIWSLRKHKGLGEHRSVHRRCFAMALEDPHDMP